VDRIANAALPAAVIMCTNRLDALDPAVKRRAADGGQTAASAAGATTTCAAVKRVLEMALNKGGKMSEVERLEKLRGHFVSARRKGVAKVLGSKSPSVLAARRLKATQDIIDALDRAIMDETRLHPPPVQQPEIGTA
jgi:hypothetical protein